MATPSVAPIHPARKVSDFVAHNATVRCAQIGAKSGQLVVSGGDDSAVNIWRIGHSGSLRSFDAKKEISQVSFDRGENRVVAGTSSGAVKLWELESCKQSLALPSAHRAAVSSIEWHPLRDNILATGGAEGVVRLWDARTGAEFLRYSGHPGAVGALKFTPHGRLIASGSSDGKLILFDLTAGKPLAETTAHKGGLSFLDFHPTEFVMVSGGADLTVKFWAMEPGLKMACCSPSHSSAVRSGKFVTPALGTAFAAVTTDYLRMWSFPPAMLGSTPSSASTISTFKTETMDLLDVPWGNVASTWVGDSVRTASKAGDPKEALHMISVSLSGTFMSIWAVNLTQMAPIASKPLHAFSVMPARPELPVAAAAPVVSKAEPIVEKPRTPAMEVLPVEPKSARTEAPTAPSVPAQPAASPVPVEVAVVRQAPTARSAATGDSKETEVPVSPEAKAIRRAAAETKADGVSRPAAAPAPAPAPAAVAATKDDKRAAINSAIAKAQEAAAVAQAARQQAADGRKPKAPVPDNILDALAAIKQVDEATNVAAGAEMASEPPVESPVAPSVQPRPTARPATPPPKQQVVTPVQPEAVASPAAVNPAVAKRTQPVVVAQAPAPAFLPAQEPSEAAAKAQAQPRSAGDFVPSTRHAPIGLDLMAFLPANTARGFGASRVLPGAMSSTLTRTGRMLAIDENAIKAISAERGECMRGLAFRLQELESAAALWAEGNVKGCIAIVRVASTTDPDVGVSFLKAFRIDSGALNLESAQLFVDLLAVLVQSKKDGAISAAATSLAGVLRAFGAFIKTNLEAAKDTMDIAAEDRYTRCNNLLRSLEGMRVKLQGCSASDLASVKQTYEDWRATLPLPLVAAAAKANSNK